MEPTQARDRTVGDRHWAETLGIELLTYDGSRGAGSPQIRTTMLEPSLWGVFSEAVAEEIGPHYPETGQAYGQQILGAAAHRDLSPFGLGTLGKIILSATRFGEFAGFTVITLKADRRIKFGPTIVFRPFRRQGIAKALRLAGEAACIPLGFDLAYSTCQAWNRSARSYVVEAGYRLVASLPSHYRPGTTELVFVKRLNVSQIHARLLGPTAEKVQVMSKRGGASRIVLPQVSLRDPRVASDAVESSLALESSRSSRRLYTEIDPVNVPLFKALQRAGFACESVNAAVGAGRMILGLNRE